MSHIATRFVLLPANELLDRDLKMQMCAGKCIGIAA